MRRRLLPLLLLAFTASVLHAQGKLAVYGTAGVEKTYINNEGWMLAGTVGLYYGLGHLGPIAIAVDARGDFSNNIDSGLFGPRIALTLPGFPIKPYFEVLGGFSRYSSVGSGSNTDVNYRWVGGLDATIIPHIDWRVVDYSYSGAGINDGGVNFHPQTLSTGIVVRF